MKAVVAGLIASCLMTACSKVEGAAAYLTDEQITAELNQRLGAKGCCDYVGKDADGRDVYSAPIFGREMHFIVRHSVGADMITCGWSGFPPPHYPAGTRTPPPLIDTLFIVRNRRLIVQGDVTSADFVRMQDELCGPDWMKPLWVTP
jgi:hypothetical protein